MMMKENIPSKSLAFELDFRFGFPLYVPERISINAEVSSSKPL